MLTEHVLTCKVSGRSEAGEESYTHRYINTVCGSSVVGFVFLPLLMTIRKKHFSFWIAPSLFHGQVHLRCSMDRYTFVVPWTGTPSLFHGQVHLRCSMDRYTFVPWTGTSSLFHGQVHLCSMDRYTFVVPWTGTCI